MISLWLKNIARLYLPVYLYQSGEKKIAYAGYSSIKKSYYTRLLLGKDHSERFARRYWYRSIKDLITRLDLDIIVSEVSPVSLPHFEKSGGFILPEWIRMRINIERPLDEIVRRNVSDFHDVMRLIKKYNLTYEMSSDEESFDFFVNRLYLPYLNKRYGGEAFIENIDEIRKNPGMASIMLIRENGETVGGSIIEKTGEEISLLRLGLIDGNEEYRRHGVIGAIYYFSIIEGQKTGFKNLEIGGTRPFLTDGLTKFKIGLSAEFLTDGSVWCNSHWVGVNEKSEWAGEFINNNPFMHLNSDHVYVRSDAGNSLTV